MKQFLLEFKTFAVRGNVVDLAVAVVIGTAFGKIVSSLVDNVIMPMIGIVLGGVDFRALAFSIGETTVSYGVFAQAILDFVIIAFVIFLAIRLMNKVWRKEDQKKEVAPSTEVALLTEIRDLLRKQS